MLDTLPCGKGVWPQFVAQTMQGALELDALQSTHAVEMQISEAVRATEAYDNLSCMKGSCLLRMISHHIGKDNFEKGIRLYLENYCMQTVNPDYFWMCLERSSRRPVR